MCRSDSGADTRDSKSTFGASLADERKGEGEGEEGRGGMYVYREGGRGRKATKI